MSEKVRLVENKSEEVFMSFWDHVEELCGRLKKVMYTFFISVIIIMILPADLSFFNNPSIYQPLMATILKKIREDTLPSYVKLIGLELLDPIQLYVVASIIFAVALTMPVLAYEIYKFIEPALYPHEKRSVHSFMASFSILFITGLVFGYKVLTPYLIWAMLPFFSMVGAEVVISIMDFYTLILITTLTTGFFFTLPVFLVLLVKHGIINTEMIARNRKYIYAILFILACIITPDGGQIGNFILFVPSILLLEIALLIAKRYENKNKKKLSISTIFGGKRKKCKFCGSRIPKDVTFCPECGRSQI